MNTPVVSSTLGPGQSIDLVATDGTQVSVQGGTAVPPGPGPLLMFPLRLDMSVNKSNVDNAQSASPIITTRTGTSAAGAFNGGGTGNKGILGFQGFSGMPLADLATIQYVWDELEAAHANPLALQVYLNLVIEPDPVGFPGVYKLLVITSTLFPVINVTVTPLGPGRWQYNWPTDANKLLFCVNPAGPAPPPLVSVWTAPAPGVPFFSAEDNTWFTQLFALADIVAAYPRAILVDASSGDGGMPNTTVTPALLAIVGDSGNTSQVSRLIEAMTVNGTNV